MELSGTIIRIDKKICLIYSQGKKYRAVYTRRRLKGAYLDQAKPVAVGDEVVFDTGQSRLGWVKQVLPRKTWLARNAVKCDKEQVVVANVEQICIVASLYAPPFRAGLIDRVLVAAHKGEIEPIIVVNKMDLKNQEKNWPEIAEKLEVYRNIGYPLLCTSIVTGEGLELLKQRLQNRTTVMAGHSGVGKSALLKALDPSLKLATKEVGRKSRRGQHTTTRVTLLPLGIGGFVADTPGVREFSIWQLEPNELAAYFPDLWQWANGCKYRTCIHIPEPDCAVKQAVARGEIAAFRYQSYCRIIESLTEEKNLAP